MCVCVFIEHEPHEPKSRHLVLCSDYLVHDLLQFIIQPSKYLVRPLRVACAH